MIFNSALSEQGKILYIEGLRGWCCVQVSIGHAVGVLLPALYWGDRYQTHFAMEAELSSMPIAFLWNAPSAMICFLVLNGFVTPLKTFANCEKQSVLAKW